MGDRVLAAFVDYVVLYGYLLAAVLTLALAGTTSPGLFVLAYLPAFFYFLLCEVFLDGQSIGKKMRRIKVARLDGGQPTLGSYLLRWLIRLVEVDLTFGLVAMVTMLATRHGQRLGDLAAGTTVVHLRPRRSLRDTIFVDVAADYTPQFPQVEVLTDEDLATTRAVLNVLVAEGKSRTGYLLGTEMKAALETRMHVQTDLPPPQFLRTVLQDANALHRM